MIKIESKHIKCPKCGKPVYADIYEIWEVTQLPTEHGFHVFCSDDPEVEICEYDYEQGTKLNQEVYKWLCLNMKKEWYK